MNEEENQEKQQNENGLAKQVGNEVINQGKRMAGDAAKKAAKQLLNKVITAIMPILLVLLKIILIVAVVAVVAGVLLAAAKWLIDLVTVQKSSEQTQAILEEYCTVDDTGIHFDKQALKDNIIQMLEESGIDVNDLKLATINSATGVIDEEKAAEYLYNFFTASMASELPYIEGSDKEARGIIKIMRKDSNTEGEARQLQYIGYEKFTEMLQSTDNNVKENAKNYFSIDESWNICVTKSYKETENNVIKQFNIMEVKIPYRTMVSQYAMPFEFLIALQSVTQNVEYVQAVADLATKNAEIELTIFDSITTTTTTETYKHSTMSKWVETHDIKDPETQEIIGTEEEPKRSGPNEQPDQVTVTVTQEESIKANITKARTWALNQETPYTEERAPMEYPLGEGGNTIEIPDDPEPEGDTGTWKVDQSINTVVAIDASEWKKTSDTTTIINADRFLGLWKNSTGYYEEYYNSDNSVNKNAKYNPDGEVVKYKLMGTGQDDRPVMNILSSEAWIKELLQNNMRTQTHAELMEYFIYLYKKGEPLEDVTLEFNIDGLISVFEPEEFVEGSYEGDFDVHDESLFITDIETLKSAFAGGYSGNEKLIANAQTFLDMQNEYKVNALFAAAVSITETSAGRAGHAIDGHNNWFNIRGGSGWANYPSDAEGIKAFGHLIANGSYYYTQGKYTVGAIGQTYCPNTPEYPTQADSWIANTKAQIVRFYAAAGIDANAYMSGSGNGAGGMTGAAGEGYRGEYTTGSGKTFVEYLQYTGPWWSNYYMGGTMKNSGCSVTSVAEILSGFGIDRNPEDVRRINPNGISIVGVLRSFGLTCTEDTNATADKILQHLNTGNPVIINAGNGYWSNGSGHYFTVLEANGNQVYVSNVGSSTKTGWMDVNKVLLQNKKVIFISR